MAISVEQLRNQLGLAEGDLQMSPSDESLFGYNEQFDQYMREPHNFLARIALRQVRIFFDVKRSISDDGSQIFALFAPYSHFVEEDKKDRVSSLVRGLISVDIIAKDRRYLSNNDFVYNPERRLLSWRQSDTTLITLEDGSYEWPCSSDDQPKVTRKVIDGKHTDSVDVQIHTGRNYEADSPIDLEQLQTGDRLVAAKNLSIKSRHCTSVTEVDIDSFQIIPH